MISLINKIDQLKLAKGQNKFTKDLDGVINFSLRSLSDGIMMQHKYLKRELGYQK